MGADKLALPLGTSTVLDELLSAVPAGTPVVVVGPSRAGLVRRSPAVLVAREDPPGGGPAAAVAAGLAALANAGVLGEDPGGLPGAGARCTAVPGGARPASPPSPMTGVDLVAVCAGDAPWSPLAVPALLAALRAAPRAGAAVAVDAAGVRQPLVAVHRAAALRARLADGEAAGASARWLLGPGPVEVVVDQDVLADVDTPEQLAAARARR